MEDSSITSLTLPKENKSDTLYIEASYDGINWSEPACGTYAEPETIKPDYSAKQYELTLSMSPYTYQYVRYTGNHNPQTRASFYGLSAGLKFNYNFEPKYSIGAGLFYSWYNYKDFHYYNALKAEVSMRYRVFESENSKYKVYLSHSIGADFVLRDDGDFGVYALFGIIGITEDMRISNKVSLNWGGDLAYTFQNGSNVLHFTPSIGITYHWGEDAVCRGC